MNYLDVLRDAVGAASCQSVLMALLPEIQDQIDAHAEGAGEVMALALEREVTLPREPATEAQVLPGAAGKKPPRPTPARTAVAVSEPRETPSPAVGWDETLDPREFPHVRWKETKDGPVPVGLYSTIGNLRRLFERYGVTVAYNEMTRMEEVYIPGSQFSIDNKANAAMAHIIDRANLNRMPTKDLHGYVTVIADEHRYHPVRDWIASKEWDGVSRLQALYDTLVVADEYKRHRNAVLRRWLISAVCAVFSENDSDNFHGVPVLVGLQGKGKTFWIKALAPTHLRAVKAGVTLNPGNKDSVLEACGRWINELGELDGTYRKTDIAELKGFITKSSDELRQAYALKRSEFKRRTVYFASVNEPKFLIDNTGNRRWWTVPVSCANWQHGIDMQQLWAEVLTLYRAGEQWHLTPEEEEELNRVNAKHEVGNPFEETLRNHFYFEQDLVEGMERDSGRGIGLNASAISHFLMLGLEGNQIKLNELGKALRKLTGQAEPKSVRGPMGPVLGWRLQPKDPALFVADSLRRKAA